MPTSPTVTPRALFVCGSINQTTQLHAVARCLSGFDAWFTPFYGAAWLQLVGRCGLADNTIGGHKLRARCLDYLRAASLQIDLDGRDGSYDLVVCCTDLLDQPNLRQLPRVIVQEGMTDPETPISRIVARVPWLPAWLAGTTLTATRGHYDRFCVASPGYRELFVQRGAPAHKLRVTGIPNFDDCQAYGRNALLERDYVLACTSDLRETAHRDDRRGFWRSALRIAADRPLHVKFHPNENAKRARRELLAICPHARIHVAEKTEELIANCAVLLTQVSSVAFVGLALQKEVHSHFDRAELLRLLPIQNGGRSADQIAAVCRELVGERSPQLPLQLSDAPEERRWAS